MTKIVAASRSPQVAQPATIRERSKILICSPALCRKTKSRERGKQPMQRRLSARTWQQKRAELPEGAEEGFSRTEGYRYRQASRKQFLHGGDMSVSFDGVRACKKDWLLLAAMGTSSRTSCWAPPQDHAPPSPKSQRGLPSTMLEVVESQGVWAMFPGMVLKSLLERLHWRSSNSCHLILASTIPGRSIAAATSIPSIQGSQGPPPRPRPAVALPRGRYIRPAAAAPEHTSLGGGGLDLPPAAAARVIRPPRSSCSGKMVPPLPADLFGPSESSKLFSQRVVFGLLEKRFFLSEKPYFL